MARLLFAFEQDNPLERIVLKAAMILPALLLQRPSPKSRSKDHTKFLQERLAKWKEGAFDELLEECRTIQARLTNRHWAKGESGRTASTFEKLVSEGNIKAATRMITEQGSSGPIPLSHLQSDGRTTKDHLHDKHPDPNPISSEALYEGPVRSSLNHPVIFTAITAETIRRTIQQMSGTAGPSGLDVRDWKRLCYSYNQASNDLCEAIACLCKRLCTEFVDPVGIEALVSCRLIALDKCPGIRPIGVGECLRRLIGRAVIQSLHQCGGLMSLLTILLLQDIWK